jgi:hypothetical protein
LGLLLVCSSVSEFFAKILHHGVFGAGLGLLAVCSSVSEFFAEALQFWFACRKGHIHTGTPHFHLNRSFRELKQVRFRRHSHTAEKSGSSGCPYGERHHRDQSAPTRLTGAISWNVPVLMCKPPPVCNYNYQTTKKERNWCLHFVYTN